MPEMDTAADEELRALRARAYGPNADITQDQTAIQRLQELEARRVSTEFESSSVVASIPVMDAVASVELPSPRASDRSHDQPSVGDAPEPSVPPDSGAAAQASGERTRRRRKMLWIASVVASSALAASVTYALTWITPVSASSGAPQIDSLEPSVAVEVPAGWFGADKNSVVFDYYGVTLFTGRSDYSAPNASDAECLFVVRTDQVPAEEDFDPTSWGFDGEMYSDCGVSIFPAAVEIPLGNKVPEELSARFPSGRSLQFVLDGDRVGVFLDSD